MSFNLTLTVSEGEKILASHNLYQTPTDVTFSILHSEDPQKAYLE